MTTSNENQKPQETLENFITESDLMKQFGVTKVLLSNMRQFEKLPFLRLNRNVKLYSERDIVVWLNSRRVVLEPRDDGVRRKYHRREWITRAEAEDTKKRKRGGGGG